jgi:hypothetical protein
MFFRGIERYMLTFFHLLLLPFELGSNISWSGLVEYSGIIGV